MGLQPPKLISGAEISDPVGMETALEPQAPEAATVPQPAITVRGLNRDYNEMRVLRDISLELPAGETLVVLGPNGAGKTTLLRILATLLRPSSGEVSVLGASLPREGWRARGRIGYLGHEPLLYRELSVRENLEFNARLHGLSPRSLRIEELLDAAGIGHRAAELVRNLSAGLRQRAGICRALIGEPELLLLDEPSSHLDLAAVTAVEELLAPAPERSRVIVTHDIEAGLASAGRVLVLGAGGSAVYSGPAASISPAEVRAVFAEVT